MEAVLRIKTKKSTKDEVIRVNQSLVVGRSKDSTITVGDEKVSGNHCRLSFLGDRLEILDLDSKNGTYLNGIRIEHSELFIGDEIRLGDTIISFNEASMVESALNVLTFPGPFKERMNYELKADFTGARIQNQLYLREHPEDPASSFDFQSQEIFLRKRANSRIKLSKEEIKSGNRTLTMISNLIDLGLLLAIIFIPIILIEDLARSQQVNLGFLNVDGTVIHHRKMTIIVVFQLISITIYFLLNMRVMKFTIGEKLSGIEDLHTRQ